jgi:alpha-amylase
MTPSEVAENLQPVGTISVPSPISWADEERDITAWLGNELQSAAFDKVNELTEKVNNGQYDQLKKDWTYLQSSDHFYYMCTKFFSDGVVHAYFNPYETPYDAFMNYMNVLSDFEIRLNRMCPASDEQIKILKFDSMIKAKDEIIAQQEIEIDALKKKLLKYKPKTKARSKISEKPPEKTKTRKLTEIAAEALAKAKTPVKTKSPVKAKTTKTTKTRTRATTAKTGTKRKRAVK